MLGGSRAQRPPLGFCSISALDRPLAAVAALATANQLDGIEATARPPHIDPSAPISAHRDTAKAVRDAGSRILAYGSYLGRAEVGGAGAVDLGDARRAAEIAAALGAPLLRVWAEPLPGLPHDGFGEVVRLLRAACEVAADRGITVVVERHLGSFADTEPRIARLMEAVDHAVFALNYQVLDLLPQSQAADQPDDARRLVPRASYFHLKNMRPAADGRGPMPPGGSLEKGVLDYRAILGAALAAGYAGPLVIEFLSFEPLPVEAKLAADAAWLRALVQDLCSSNFDVAR
jgi:sugar phosphate isomerase/epimerase